MTEFEFTLNQDEVRAALYITGRLKPYKKKSLIQAIIAGLVFISFLVSAIMYPHQTTNYIAMAAMLLVIVLVTVFPKQTEDRIVKGATTYIPMSVKLNQDKITVNVPQTGAVWDVEKPNVAYIKQDDVIFAIVLKDGRILVIPKRVADEKAMSELQQIIDYFNLKEKLGEI
ncbi:MAG: hypothetical protein IJF54_05850 [Clostridia bacterium]|nr:hypothetical protein [Clostridia bacterium]